MRLASINERIAPPIQPTLLAVIEPEKQGVRTHELDGFDSENLDGHANSSRQRWDTTDPALGLGGRPHIQQTGLVHSCPLPNQGESPLRESTTKDIGHWAEPLTSVDIPPRRAEFRGVPYEPAVTSTIANPSYPLLPTV